MVNSQQLPTNTSSMAKQQKSKKNKPGPQKKKQVATAKRLPAFFYNTKVNCWILLFFSLLLYANTLSHQYTQDDAIVIYDNMYTTQGLKGIPGLLKYDTFKGFFKVEGKDKLVSGGRYRPLTPMMFALEWQLFKRPKKDASGKVVTDTNGATVYEGSPWIGHLLNALFYGLTGIVIYLLLLQVLTSRFGNDMAVFVGLMTALLFIAHPIHTEAVANIKGRDEIITLLGSLAALYYSWRAYHEEKPVLNIAAAVLFFLALLSKENAITFLAVVPLAFYFFSKADMGSIVKQTAYLFGAAVLFLIIRGSILGWSLGEPSMELMNNPYLKIVNNQWVPFSTGEKLATIVYTLGYYIKLLFVPHPLTHDYYPRHIDIMGFGNWQVLLSLALYAALAFFAFRGFRQKTVVSFGILFFLITLSIVSNIVFPVGTNMSERFMFMPSVGFCLVLAALGWQYLIKDKNKKAPLTLTTAFAVFGLVLVLLSAKTVTRNTVWSDNFTLFKTDVAVSQNSAKLLNAVGAETSVQAAKLMDRTTRDEMLKEALVYLNKAITIHPTYKNTYLQLGNAHNYLREYEKAVQYYNQVLKFDPNDQNGYNNLGITYREGGKYFGEQGNMQKAMQYLTKALEMRGDEYETLRLLGVAHGVSGNHPKAVEYFTKATEVEPNNADAFWNLGNAWFYAGDQAKADQFRNKALQMDPNVANRQKQLREGQ